MSKLSPWFNAREHKPVRPGWYEVQWRPASGVYRMKWDGKRWRGNAFNGFSTFRGDQWRGLLK